MSSAVSALFAGVRDAIATATASHPNGLLFAGVNELLARDGRAQQVESQTRSVVDDWLATAVDAAPDPWRDLANHLLAASPELPWMRSYENLESSPDLERFREFYSYALLAGPNFRGHEPPVVMDELLLGFSLQAPNIFYPQHHHEPSEMYGIISGTVEWQVGNTWTTVRPGDVMVHRSHESHAMRTLDEPVLTWVVWPCNPDCSVYMPSFDPADTTMEPRSYE